MMKLEKRFLVVLCLIPLVTCSAWAENLLINSDFEQGETGWERWWGGNSDIGDHSEDHTPYPPGMLDAGVWWPDDGVQQSVTVGPGKYEFGGLILKSAGDWPLINGRQARITAAIGDGVNDWWYQWVYIDETYPAGVWSVPEGVGIPGNGIIDNTSAGATTIRIICMLRGADGEQFTGSGLGYFDNLYLRQLPPEQATEPYPANGAVDLPLDTILSWQAPADMGVTQHFVYLLPTPADPNAAPAYAISRVALATDVNDLTGTFDPGVLAYNTTYLWTVDLGVDGSQPYDPNTLKGDTWSFTTMADPNAAN